MMKLVFLAVAFIALVQPSVQLTCYECKSERYTSANPDFNDNRFQICEEDQNKWPKRNSTGLGFDCCKKIVEKVKSHNDKEAVMVIRTIGVENMKLDKDIFTEYNCKEDLCNSGVTLCATAYAALLSIIVSLTTNL